MDVKRNPRPSLKELRESIPKHCFQPSNLRSLAYIVQDLALAFSLALLAYYFTPKLNLPLKIIVWTGYGVVQGMVMTGIWILAHECGHQALFTNRLNDYIGFVLHSMLLVPYFSWKYSHSLHHRYTNHMEKDTVFVPYRKSEQRYGASILKSLHVAEDAPALNLTMLIFHQLLGWPGYILFNISAGRQSLKSSTRDVSKRQSHLDPLADNFSNEQHPYVFLSDLGLILVLSSLYILGTKTGFGTVVGLYLVPWLFVNNWIVAITYLHHTHPSAKHYEADRWSFVDGALSTIDRDFGWIGRNIFHGIIEFHVIHHLCVRIPFYHAEEATWAIRDVLGDAYLRVETAFIKDLWKTWVSCQYVEEADRHAKGVLVWSRV